MRLAVSPSLKSHSAGDAVYRVLRAVQVPVQGQHQSCCAVVENCQRCMFFIPQPGVFSGAELATLEAESASDASQKIALIRHLHVGFHCGCASCLVL